MKNGKHLIQIDLNNDYVKAIIKSFHQFLIEESADYCNSELRLNDKIKAARELFGEEKRALSNGMVGFSSRRDTENTELLFTLK